MEDLFIGLVFLLCAALIAFQAHERNEWRKERMELIQRLQAPELAVAAHKQGRDGPPEAIAPIALDDDEAYEKLRLEREGLVAD